MIQIKTKASKGKKPIDTGWKCKASITYKKLTEEQFEALTPTERKYITAAAKAYSEWETSERCVKYARQRLFLHERERIKTLQAYSRYLQKENSPVSGFITVMMRVIQYSDYILTRTQEHDDVPF